MTSYSNTILVYNPSKKLNLHITRTTNEFFIQQFQNVRFYVLSRRLIKILDPPMNIRTIFTGKDEIFGPQKLWYKDICIYMRALNG